MTNLFWSV